MEVEGGHKEEGQGGREGRKYKNREVRDMDRVWEGGQTSKAGGLRVGRGRGSVATARMNRGWERRNRLVDGCSTSGEVAEE